jgi:hypothetical protein
MIATARGDLLRPAALTTGSSQRRPLGASAQVTGSAAVGRCAAALSHRVSADQPDLHGGRTTSRRSLRDQNGGYRVSHYPGAVTVGNGARPPPPEHGRRLLRPADRDSEHSPRSPVRRAGHQISNSRVRAEGFGQTCTRLRKPTPGGEIQARPVPLITVRGGQHLIDAHAPVRSGITLTSLTRSCHGPRGQTAIPYTKIIAKFSDIFGDVEDVF